MRLRPATEKDIAWIVGQEARADMAAFIHRWPADRHRACLADADYSYLIAEPGGGGVVGYLILRGLGSAERSIELVRILAAEQGQGIGRFMLSAGKRFVFEELAANRLWLDVFDDNERARRAYRAAGFVEEGLLRESCLRADGRLGSLVIISILGREYENS